MACWWRSSHLRRYHSQPCCWLKPVGDVRKRPTPPVAHTRSSCLWYPVGHGVAQWLCLETVYNAQILGKIDHKNSGLFDFHTRWTGSLSSLLTIFTAWISHTWILGDPPSTHQQAIAAIYCIPTSTGSDPGWWIIQNEVHGQWKQCHAAKKYHVFPELEPTAETPVWSWIKALYAW